MQDHWQVDGLGGMALDCETRLLGRLLPSVAGNMWHFSEIVFEAELIQVIESCRQPMLVVGCEPTADNEASDRPAVCRIHRTH
jgi:hypothetical protein